MEPPHTRLREAAMQIKCIPAAVSEKANNKVMSVFTDCSGILVTEERFFSRREREFTASNDLICSFCVSTEHTNNLSIFISLCVTY